MLVTLAAMLLSAQTLTVQLKPNTPFVVQWEQRLEDALTPKWRWWCNGVIVKNFAMAEVKIGVEINPTDRTQVLTATVPGLPAGKHECLVSAFDEGFTELKSDPIPLTVSGGITTPLRLRVLVTIPGGGG